MGEGDGEELVQSLSLVCISVGNTQCGFQTLLFYGLADTRGCLLQNDGVSGFRNCQGEQDPKATGYGHQDPVNPPPAEIEADVAARYERQRRSECGAQTVNCHGTTGLLPFHRSLMAPLVLVRGAPPANPPMNLHTRIVPMLGASAMGSWKMKSMNQETT